MDFNLSEEQQAFRTMAAEFAIQEIAPHAQQWDETSFFPQAALKKAAALGFAGMYVRPDVNGSGLSRLDAALIFEELATACVSTAAYLAIHNMVAWMIDAYAEESLRRKWAPALVNMDVFGSYCLTEPQSGSDAASLQTRATLIGDEYIINGSKAFISGGSTSDVYLCMVRTGDDSPHGISCLLIEKDRPGISFGKREYKLGWRNQPTSMVFFEDCRVPKTNLIGEEGTGFKIAMHALNGGRINIAACSIGGAQACLTLARQYLNTRQQFQHKLADFQALQFRMADLFTDLEASRLLVWRAANSLDHHHPDTPLYCAMAKRYATDACFEIANQAIQLHGGYGYLHDYQIERYFRDLRVHSILEGTNEIMRLIIARRLLSESFVI